MSAASSVLFPPITPQGQFMNPYAIDVLKTMKGELIEGIKNPEELINLLVEHGIFSTDKKMVMSYYRTRTEKNSRLVDILLSKDGRRQLVGYLLERDKEDNQAPILEPPEKIPRKENLPKKVKKETQKTSVQVKEKKRPKPETPRQKVVQSSDGVFDAVMKAAQNNHHHLVKLFLQEEEKLYKNRSNFLHLEAAKDNSRLVEILLKNGANVDSTDEKKQTALYHAVSGGHQATVKVLLEAGATIDPSIIDVAFSTNNEYIFGLLLQYSKGLSPDTMISAMFKAVKLNLFGIIKALIDKGTDVNARNDIQYTPLLLAAELGKPEAAQALIEKGAHIEDRTPNLSTALHLSVQGGDVSTMKLLLRKGINVNITGPGDQTPLHVAAYHNRPDLCDILLSASANVNAVTKEAVTPLHLASQRNNVDVAQNLIEHKANVNAKDKQARTPLHMAAEVGGLALVQLLLNNKADPNISDKEKKSPLHIAAAGGSAEVVAALLNSQARYGPKDMDGCTPIHYATISGNMDIVKSLLKAGKNKNLEDKNVWRKTPLHLAAEHGHSDIIQLLLTNGAAIDPLDNNRDTPLHCACKSGHLSSVQTLVGWSQGQKANLQATNSLKKTPLQVAEAGTTDSHQQVATLLKKKMLIIK
ncbi:unnamed protein product [Ranitomeya imitator]|uniref:CARD domain-containing protein n=1 Tax=Ranitomeya imitator TaxID=111125 RepID=A0ABN9LGA4_9NEOB|nr:unnamed protein product [Ranitomeya imitator]